MKGDRGVETELCQLCSSGWSTVQMILIQILPASIFNY